MRFFRRPSLAGNNLVYQDRAFIRGSVRRKDPDISSGVPYFPGVSAGDEIVIASHTGNVTVTLTSGSFHQILADLDQAFLADLGSGQLKATDADGCVGILALQPGSAGYVAVVGGTPSALSALGLNPFEGGQVASRGGDLRSTLTGDVGNPHGTAFPSRRENLTAESVNRVAGRLSANLDVLHSDLVRDDAVMMPAEVSHIGYINPQLSFITLAQDVRVFTGLDLLSRSSSKEELASHFVIIDRVTNLPALNRVVGVANGVPSGSVTIPLPDTASWSSVDGGNVLGVDAPKVVGSAISAVHGGRVVRCAGASFLTAGVRAGDLAEIAAATNISPWSHNGYRWVVEEVLDEESLSLRPMSQVELATLGTPGGETQPILELNAKLGAAETYGTLTIRTGSYWPGATLIVSPPIPDGAQYDVWVSQPVPFRERANYAGQRSFSPVSSERVSDLGATPNGFLRAPFVSIDAVNLNASESYVRWNGRVYHVPAWSYPHGSLSIGTSYIYWDNATALLKVSSDPTDVFQFDANDPDGSTPPPTKSGHLVATVTKDGGTGAVTFQNAQRQIVSNMRTVTVGEGGEFNKLDRALEYINSWSTGASGSDDWDVVLVSDLIITAPVTIKANVRLRGTSPTTTIFSNTGHVFRMTSGSLLLEDITIHQFTTNSVLSIEGGIPGNIIFRNVRLDPQSLTQSLVWAVSGVTVPSVTVLDCDLALVRGVVKGQITRVSISGTRVTYRGTTAHDPQVVSGPSATYAPTPWDGTSLSIINSRFIGWHCKSTYFLADSTNLAANILVTGSVFDFANTVEAGSQFLQAAGEALISDCRIGSTGAAPSTIFSAPKGSVRGSVMYVSGSSVPTAVDCRQFVGNIFQASSTPVGGVRPSGPAVAVKATYATGNYINTNAIGIQCGNALSTISGNSIYSTSGPCIDVVSRSATIAGNCMISEGGRGISVADTDEVSIAGNRFHGCDTYGVQLSGVNEAAITGNLIVGVSSITNGSGTGIICLTSSKVSVIGNRISSMKTALAMDGECDILDNVIQATIAFAGVGNSTTKHWRALNNRISGDIDDFVGEFEGNRVYGATGIKFSGPSRIADCHFEGDVNIDPTAGDVLVSACKINGTLAGTASGSALNRAVISNTTCNFLDIQLYSVSNCRVFLNGVRCSNLTATGNYVGIVECFAGGYASATGAQVRVADSNIVFDLVVNAVDGDISTTWIGSNLTVTHTKSCKMGSVHVQGTASIRGVQDAGVYGDPCQMTGCTFGGAVTIGTSSTKDGAGILASQCVFRGTLSITGDFSKGTSYSVKSCTVAGALSVFEGANVSLEDVKAVSFSIHGTRAAAGGFQNGKLWMVGCEASSTSTVTAVDAFFRAEIKGCYTSQTLVLSQLAALILDTTRSGSLVAEEGITRATIIGCEFNTTVDVTTSTELRFADCKVGLTLNVGSSKQRQTGKTVICGCVVTGRMLYYGTKSKDEHFTTISNNQISSPFVEQYALEVIEASNCIIDGNMVEGDGGIYFHGSGDNTIVRNAVIKGNVIRQTMESSLLANLKLHWAIFITVSGNVMELFKTTWHYTNVIIEANAGGVMFGGNILTGGTEPTYTDPLRVNRVTEINPNGNGYLANFFAQDPTTPSTSITAPYASERGGIITFK